MSWLLFVIVGLLSGLLMGILGAGGGIVLVPALMYFADFSQKMAIGTTLAVMLPPIGIAAAIEYHRHGNVDLKVAVILAASLIIGSWFGAKMANELDERILKTAFGIFLILLGTYTVLKVK